MTKHAIQPLEKNSLNVSTSVVQLCRFLLYELTRKLYKLGSIIRLK